MMSRRSEPFSEAEVKCILVQLLRAVQHIHDQGYLHRDIKTSNLLYQHGTVKLADFGLAKEGFDTAPGRHSTKVVTLWFRAPELLLGSTTYDQSLDMWSVGCIAGELMQNRPLFPAPSEVEALSYIARLLGPPTPARFERARALPPCPESAMSEGREAMKRALATVLAHGGDLPRWSTTVPLDGFPAVFSKLCPEGLDFLRRLLCYDPKARMTASQALAHPYLTSVEPCPLTPADMPYCPDQLAMDEADASAPSSSSSSRVNPRPYRGGGGGFAVSKGDVGDTPGHRLIVTSAKGLHLFQSLSERVMPALHAWDQFEYELARSRGDHSRGDHSRGDHSRGDHSRGDHSRGDRSRGDRSRGDHSRGDHPRSDSFHGVSHREEHHRRGHARRLSGDVAPHVNPVARDAVARPDRAW
jgi:serine/threonine protein kinase